MDDVETRAILPRVQVMMTDDHSFRVALVQFLKQSSHGSLLSRRSGIGGLTADIEPALIADTNRVGIVVLAVGTCQPFRTAWLYCSVPTDHVVVADTEFPMVIPAMPRVDLSGRGGLVRPDCRTVNNN